MSAGVQHPKAGVPRVRVARTLRDDCLFRLNRALLYAMMLAYLPLVLVPACALGFAAYWVTALAVRALWFAPGFGIALLAALVIPLDLAVLATIALLVFGLLPLFFRNTSARPPGEWLDLRRHANLAALVQRLCARLNVRAPEYCLLMPDDTTGIGDISFREADGAVSHNVRTLLIGAAHVVHTRVDELATILCHEMAHAATGDTRLGKLTMRLHDSLGTQMLLREDTQERGWLNFFLWLLAAAYFYLFTLLYCKDDRYRELRADRIAAEVCGPQNMRNALIKVYLAGHLTELSIERLWTEYCQTGQDLQNLYAEHRRRWAALSPARRAQAESEIFMQPSSVWSTHPSLAERVRNLADVTAKEFVCADPAGKLFRHWEALEQQITAHLLSVGRAAFEKHLAEVERKTRLPI